MYVAPIVGSGDRFVGSVYVMGHEDDDACVFRRRDDDDETFYNLIRFDSCGRAANSTDVSVNVNNNNIIFFLMKSRQNARYTCTRLSRRTENNACVCQTHDDGIP